MRQFSRGIGKGVGEVRRQLFSWEGEPPSSVIFQWEHLNLGLAVFRQGNKSGFGWAGNLDLPCNASIYKLLQNIGCMTSKVLKKSTTEISLKPCFRLISVVLVQYIVIMVVMEQLLVGRYGTAVLRGNMLCYTSSWLERIGSDWHGWHATVITCQLQ